MSIKPKGGKPKAATVPAPPPATYKASPSEVAEVAAYNARKTAQRKPATVTVNKHEGRRLEMAMAPAVGKLVTDESAGMVAAARLANSFGLGSYSAAVELFNQLINGTRTKEGADEGRFNAALALVAEIAPNDAIEAMLAVQMVGANTLIAQIQQRVVNSVETIPQLEANGSLLVKLLRTFTAQVEALKRYRTGGEQRVTVQHQHVTVNADKAAVAVNPPGGPGATIKAMEQSHAPRPEQLAYAPGDPMPGALEADREAVPESSR